MASLGSLSERDTCLNYVIEQGDKQVMFEILPYHKSMPKTGNCTCCGRIGPVWQACGHGMDEFLEKDDIASFYGSIYQEDGKTKFPHTCRIIFRPTMLIRLFEYNGRKAKLHGTKWTLLDKPEQIARLYYRLEDDEAQGRVGNNPKCPPFSRDKFATHAQQHMEYPKYIEWCEKHGMDPKK